MIAQPEQFQDTFADLHRAIGEVPLHRIARSPAPGTATEQDVIDALEGTNKRLYELVDGVLVEKAVATKESLFAGMVFGHIWDYLRESDIGIVLAGDGPLRLLPGNVRLPDVSFISWDQFPDGKTPDDKIWAVNPTLAVEVLSASNTKSEIERKLQDYFSSGCKLVWILDPESRTAKVYTSAMRHKQLNTDGVLDGAKVLPGFKLPLHEVFAASTRQKKKPR